TKNTPERRLPVPSPRRLQDYESSVRHRSTADQRIASHPVRNGHGAAHPSQLSDQYESRHRLREFQKAKESSQLSLISKPAHERFLSAHKVLARLYTPSLLCCQTFII